jgi:hypothetical protein
MSVCSKGDLPLLDVGIVVDVAEEEPGGAPDQAEGCTDRWTMRCSSAVYNLRQIS